jgi:hypothetical protein
MGPHDEHRGIPVQETRGGDRVDWKQAVPGEPLPELPPDAYPEPDSEQLPLFDDDINQSSHQGTDA